MTLHRLERAFLVAFVALLAFLVGRGGVERPSRAAAEAMPLSFESNRGQSGENVDFIARSASGTSLIDGRGVVHAAPGERRAIALTFAGSADPDPEAAGRLRGTVNYLVGDEPFRWLRDVPTWARVSYRDLYPGVDVVWYGHGGALEYDLRLAPRANPEAIAMRAGGADWVRVAPNGDLVIEAGQTRLRQSAPVAFQSRPRTRIPIKAGYRVEGKTIAFELGRYDRSRALVIDPVLLPSPSPRASRP